MEGISTESSKDDTVQSQDLEVEDQGSSRANLQRAHARIAVQLGDVACEGRETVSTEGS